MSAKSTKTNEMIFSLIATDGIELVHVSPDAISGINYNIRAAEANKDTWGASVLGKIIMIVRNKL